MTDWTIRAKSFRCYVIIVFAALVLTGAAFLRAPEYDEAYSIFLTAGHARPAWPKGVFRAGDVRGLYAGKAGLGQIAHDLRTGDVHPPLYFWALEFWRRLVGPGWFAARLLSVLFSLAALATLARLAALAEIPVVPALLITLLSYGFAYTGIVARGFALAQFLNVAGVALIFAGVAKKKRGVALAGGLALGAASFSNYLACFTGAAGLVWLLLAAGRRRYFAPAAFGFALFLPADWYFFAAQKSSRIGQFTAFSPRHALPLLARDAGAAWFGGLPLYAGYFTLPVGLALAFLLASCLGFVLRRWRPAFLLFALAALANPAGLLALGVIFNNTPIEIRYLAFSLPFLALLFAAALPWPLRGVLLAIELCAIAGLAFAPATMQPQALAARQAAAMATPGSVVLLPYGNDGVGVPGPFIQQAPDDLRIQLVQGSKLPNLAGAGSIVLSLVSIDAASRATSNALLTALNDMTCWQSVATKPLAAAFRRTCASGLPTH